MERLLCARTLDNEKYWDEESWLLVEGRIKGWLIFILGISRQDGEDVLQIVKVNIWRCRTYDPDRRAAWQFAYAITRNAAKDWKSKNRAHLPLDWLLQGGQRWSAIQRAISRTNAFHGIQPLTCR